MKIVIFGDMHLSNIVSTPQEAVLEWAISETEKIKPDLCVCVGDVTACGSVDACKRYLDKINALSCKVMTVIGNSDIRNKETISQITDYLKCDYEGVKIGDYRIVGIDNSTGKLSPSEKQKLKDISQKESLIVISHIPPRGFDDESKAFIKSWINERRSNNQKILLWAAGHTHKWAEREFEGVKTITVCALDPDKNINGYPHICVADIEEEKITFGEKIFENDMPSHWTDEEIKEFSDFLGITCYDIPKDMKFVLKNGVKNLEWRSAEEKYLSLLKKWREAGGRTFSVHMPSLGFKDGKVTGKENYIKRVNEAINANADMITVHPPAVINSLMLDGGEAFGPLADTMAEILKPIVEAGILIVFENNHTPAGTCNNTLNRDYGCSPEELMGWQKAIEERLGANISKLRLDIGHARNNVPVSQDYTLGKWYSLTGNKCGAYHIHQTIIDDKGLMHNHYPINGWHNGLISLDSFLWAWHTGMLNHAPLILEIREGEGAPATWKRLQKMLKEKANDDTGFAFSHLLFKLRKR